MNNCPSANSQSTDTEPPHSPETGGAFAVISHNNTGKLSENLPVYNGHTAAVLDTDFNPFNDHVVASASEDTRVGC